VKTINRTGKTITYRTFTTGDLVCQNSLDTRTLHDNTSYDFGMGHDQVKMWVYGGAYDSGTFFAQAMFGAGPIPSLRTGPLLNTTHVVLRHSGSDWHAVDWGALNARWTGQAAAAGASSTNDPTGLAMAQALIGALATGIAALGPAGALPSGLLLGVGSLVLIALGAQQDAPPPPPDIDAITTALRNVLQEEDDQRDADKYAEVFLTAGSWCIRQARLAHAELKGKGAEATGGELSDHDLQDFRRQLENYAADNEDFQTRLTYIRNRPRIAKYILPGLIAGLAADLQIKRLHLMLRHLDGTRLTDENLTEFLTAATHNQTALNNAAEALRQHASKIVEDAHLTGTAEGVELTRLVIRTYTGQDDLGFLNNMTLEFGAIINTLQQDISRLRANRPTEGFWKPEWDTHPRARGKAHVD
jgi:hypothetical protein